MPLWIINCLFKRDNIIAGKKKAKGIGTIVLING